MSKIPRLKGIPDFRDDISYYALESLKKYGLTHCHLKEFQEKVPVVYPWNEDYDRLRYDVNRSFNVFPLMIVMAKHKKDVYNAFKFAKEYQIPFVLRGGSHSFEGYSLCDGMVIDQSRRNNIHILDGKVKFDAGTLLGPLLEKLYTKKLMMPVGLCPNNGSAGFILGGGIGLFTRCYGTTADNLIETEIITADGKLLTVNENSHPDLFWAIRGGGGNNFGIHLNFTVKTYPIDKVYVFYIKYTYDKIKDIIRLWEQLYPTYPTSISIDLRAVGEKGMVGVSGIYRKDDVEELERLLSPFKAIETTSVYQEQMPYFDSVKYFGGTGRWLPFFKIKTGFVKDTLPEEALDIIAKYMEQGLDSFNISFKTLGGRNDEIASNAIAFPHRNVKAWFLIDAQWSIQSDEESSTKWCRDFYNEIEPYLTCGVYVNAPDRDLDNYLERYYLDNLPKLKMIKKAYDPENVFNFPQSISF
jgi:FAD/FMN-containing dehydrogenase